MLLYSEENISRGISKQNFFYNSSQLLKREQITVIIRRNIIVFIRRTGIGPDFLQFHSVLGKRVKLEATAPSPCTALS